MDTIVSYASGAPVSNNLTSVPTTLTTSETQLFVHTKLGSLRYSQFTVYLQVTLGGVTSGTFYYYFTPEYAGASTVWYPVCVYNTSTGSIPRRAVVVDSTAYATGGVSYAVDELPVGATSAFLITGSSASGTPAFTIKVMSRNN